MASPAANATQPLPPPPRLPRLPRPAIRERRRTGRIPSVTAGKVGHLPVQVFDISLDGVGFRSESLFAPSSIHSILIGNGPMYLEGTIRITSVRSHPNGTYDIGANFV